MSFQYRRFFTDEATAMPDVMPNIAEIMAKSGIKNDGDSSDAIPNIIIGEAEPKTPAPPTGTVAEKQTAVEAETVPKVESSPAIVEQTKTPSQPAAVVGPPAVDWKQELKKADTAEILKELGFDDKMVGFFNKWRTDGNITDYIKAVSVDFTKMSPEQLMKYQLEQEFPDWSAEDLEELYQAKIVDTYKLNPEAYSEMEAKRGKLMLTADAKAVREKLMQRQQEFILSAKPPAAPDPAIEAKREADEQSQVMEQYTSAMNASQFTKDLMSSKKLVLGEGENAFNYEVPDPQGLVNILSNPTEYAKHVFKEDGSPLVDKHLFIAAAVKDHSSLINELIKHGIAIGSGRVAKQLENPSQPAGKNATPDPAVTNPAEALAKMGVITSGN